MANDIENKLLWNGLGNVSQSDWISAARTLGISVVKSNKGTSHFINLRDPKNTNLEDIRGLISTVTPNCYKQYNQRIFKKILCFCKANGKSEKDLWAALGKS